MGAKKRKKGKPEGRVLATNRKAFHDYYISEKFEAGIALLGTEVKSLREGRANLKESYCRPEGGEIFLVDCHISPYSHGTAYNHEPLRHRKLLLSKREIRRLIGAASQKGFTIVPLRFYLKERLIKLEIGLAKGKHTYDKRETKRRKDIDRETERAMKDYS
jgi:SsrA-binding protein